MANYFLCLCLLRIALPICLTLSIIFRPCVLSALYLLLLLYLPIAPVPTQRSMTGHTGCYLKIVICISFLTSISQLTFQIVLLSLPPYGHFLDNCNFLEKLLRHIGFVKLDTLSAVDVIQWLSPEITMLFASIGIYSLCGQLILREKKNNSAASEEGTNTPDAKPKKSKSSFLLTAGRYLSLASLCIAGCLRPSIPGAFYFIIFLGAATFWACYKELRKVYAYVLRIVMVVAFFHISALYAYQFQWPQELLHPNSTFARYFGLTPIMNTQCDHPGSIQFNDVEWASYLNPIWLLWLYYILALESKLLLMPQAPKITGTFSRLDGSFNGPLRRQMSQRLSNRRLVRAATTSHKWQSATRKVRYIEEWLRFKDYSQVLPPSERTPLIRGVSPSRKYGASVKTGILQDSTGSITVTGDGQDDIPMEPLSKGTAEEELHSSCLENVINGMASIFQVLVRSSYIATNITMMAWSITFHSWLTFVLLLWANLLWLLPNQRRAMLRSAPFLVLYAIFLLLSAYVYGMNLTEDELPSKVQNINLAQIGFEKILILPCKTLLAKCLFTTMFWITLRQFMHERQEARQTSALADMVAPLQVTVGTATSSISGSNAHETKGSKTMKKLGAVVKKILTKAWIWVVAINLFVVAITGERMTGFRIIYMFLFLLFILTFQLSFKVWRKIMYGFWITVIGYSMLTLVLVYTYQFDHFSDYWTDYLHIPPEQQLDIGLESYETKQLFVRLLTPTFFVVITVVQVHYFHKDFLEISDIKARQASITREVEEIRSDTTSAQGGPWEHTSEKTDTDTITVPSIRLKDWKNRGKIIDILSFIYRQCQHLLNHMWLFLELHMFKIVLLIAMLLAVYDACAIHFAILLLAVTAVTLGRKTQTVAMHLCAIIVSVMFLARMIYQIKYIDHSKWDVYCDNSSNTTTNSTDFNSAEWLGFRKLKNGDSLSSLVIWYIGFILVVTARAIVSIRQVLHRIENGKNITRPFFMFPKITRAVADKNMLNCIKYMMNYGFYKFGVEICLMATVALIGIRMDFYAVLYGCWLSFMFVVSRELLSKVWNFYLAFIAFVLPLQYFMVVGLPPALCVEFPWDIVENERLRRMQDWMYLLDNQFPPSSYKLICDIILLILVARQAIVFRIERRYDGLETEYPGGSNQSIVHLAEQPGFINPVPDFITYIRSWLDIFKRGVLCTFIYITLAIVFLAGTNRVNLFSMGYLIGSFIFLWQGSDLYLHPISKILRAWNMLLGYNVFVIVTKTILQILGCIFINDIYECWLLRLLGIGCIKKFGSTVTSAGITDPIHCAPVPREDIGLAWDGICFGFLLMQRRIFNSYNFFHVIDESKATTILASRGADLIEELRDKQMSQKNDQERKILEKIKLKMDKIKATQQRIQGPKFKEHTNHFVEEDEEEECAPIARSPSLSSCTSATSASEHTPEAGYHTPIDEEDPPPLTPRTGSLLQTQAPSTPCSALMTVSLDGYLEPQRMSFSSPPGSELNQRAPSLDESFPVFSPPPYDDDDTVVQRPRHQRQTSIGPPWMQGSLVTPRQSIISYSSRSPQSHHTYNIFPGTRPLKQRKVATTYRDAIRSGDYYMFDDLDEDELDLITEKDDDLGEHFKDTADGKITVGELMSNAMKTDIGTAMRRTSVPLVQRRASMPLARQRSCVSTRSHLSAPLPVLFKPERGSPRRTDRGPVTIQEEARIDEIEESKPGGSKRSPEEMSLLSDDEPKPETKCQACINVLRFIWVFIESLMNTVTNCLNKLSRDCRYVLKVLSKEKKLLKERSDFRLGVRRGSTQIWEPSGSFQSLVRRTSEDSADTTASADSMSPTGSYRRALCTGRLTDARDDDTVEFDHQPSSLEPIIPRKKHVIQATYSGHVRRKASVLTVPEIRILAPSMERGLDSSPGSETPVDIMVDYEAEMSSADQPAIVRLLLAIWFTILSHSDIVCYFIIFLNQMKSASVLALPLPLMVFLWGTLTIPRPSKTFWITIIAYTEVIVLIKCVFQFKILDEVPAAANNPFYAPRIIGIERTSSYATYDLLLLLVVFFHRLMLKSLGLWKSGYDPPAILEDGIYKMDEEEEEEANLRRDLSNAHKINETEVFKEVNEISSASQQEDMLDTIHSDDKSFIQVTSTEIKQYDQFANTWKVPLQKYTEALREFFVHLLDPTSRITVDVYAYMFMCDFFNFMVVIFGFAAFGTQQGDGGVSAYLQENKVPIPFLLMLILQFILIIVDRALFLRKYILGKIIFQFMQIIGVHIWMFFVLPAVTERSFNARLPPQMWYMVKCFYLLLSAYQIRCGYPTRILGNFLCKGHGYVNMVLFKGFMAIPFLFELRTIMDWMWTDTSMTVFDWLKMEDIFAHIFQLKCSRHVESEYPQPRGKKKKVIVKYIMGGAGLFLIIAVIWFPLVFFALGNTVGEANIPYDVTVNMRIGPYQPIYSMSAQSNSIYRFSETEFDIMKNNLNKRNRVAQTFLSSYEHEDVAAVILNGNSTMVWSISPPDLDRMLAEVRSTHPLSLRLQYIVSRLSNNKQESGIISSEIEIKLEYEVNGKPNPEREMLDRMLSGDSNVSPILVQRIFPKFVKVTNRAMATPIWQLLDEGKTDAENSLRNLTMKLSRSSTTTNATSPMWWEIREDCSDPNYLFIIKRLPHASCDYIVMYTFNEKSFPASLSFLSGGGIIGLYTTLVFVASRMIRGFFSEICFKIMFDDMPNVDRVLQLCLDIYLVREARELCLEEDLFAKVVFLFRSPETLIKWTRPKEDDEIEGDDPEDEPQRAIQH